MTNAVNLAAGASTGVGLVPAGVVLPYAAATAPTGWLICDGSAVSRTTYAALFAAIGTTYGAGDGSTTFNLPAAGDRVIAGKGSTKTTLGGTGGSTAQTPSGTVGNTTLSSTQIPSHSHGYFPYQASSAVGGAGLLALGGGSGYRANEVGLTGGSGAHNHGLSMDSLNVEQPFIVLNYIIKV